MSKERKKLQKKKEREREAQQKVLARREEIREPIREENRLHKKLKRIKKLKRDLGSLNIWADEVYLKASEKTLSQLEHNAKILQALEDEHRKEQEKRQAINDKLEAEGHTTLNDKLKSMHDKVVAMQALENMEIDLTEEETAKYSIVTQEIEENVSAS